MSVRKFELQIFDDAQNMLDRFPLDKVVSPSGLGFTQTLTVVETKTIDYIVDRAIKKKDIKMTILFDEPLSYLKANNFRKWYCSHINNKLVLKYSDGSIDRYMDVAIKEFQVTEIDTGYNAVPIVLQTLSPFYVLKLKRVLTAMLSNGKNYNYSYPYSYGGGRLEGNIIENDYFEPTPLYVKINGPVTIPTISLKDENGVIYSTVKFIINGLLKGQSIVVDAINTKIQYFESATSTPVDYYNYLDKSKNSFLYAKHGVSSIIANLSVGDPDSSVQVVYVQYVL
jgi:hypothetical protein